MAYAQLAGLPIYYGLYASFLPTIFAAMFGSSNHLSTGPTAVVSLLTSVALEPLATSGSEAYIAYAILLSLTIGIFRLSLGILRLGLIVNFLSLPVVNSYTSAAAIIIATSQLSRMFGVYVNEGAYHYQTVENVISAALIYTHLPTLLIACSSLTLMFLLKKYVSKIPFILVTVVIFTFISWASGFEHDVAVNIKNIKSPEIVNMIKQFNVDMHLLVDHASERTKLRDKIDAMKSADSNAFRVVDEQYYASLIGIKIKNEKHESQILRDELNNFMLEAGKSKDGKLLFYNYGKIPKGMEKDERIWRVKVRNYPINESAVLITGGGSVVGNIPKGLPAISMPNFDLNVFLRFLPMALIITLLGFMEAISIGKSIAVKSGQKIDPNQELIGQGLANIIGSFGQSYPVSGSFSRSAINFHSGAFTGIANIVSSLVIVLTLYFFTNFLYFLPKAVLASVIIMAVLSLMNIKGFINAWKAHRIDGAISTITFIVTLIFAPHLEYGILAGVTISLIVYLYNSMRPRIVSLSMADDFSLRSAKRYGLKECNVITALRFDGSLFFANSTYLDDTIVKIMAQKPKIKHFLIVCNGINDLDYSGACALKLVIEKIRVRGLGISFSGINEKVMKILERTGLIDFIGTEHIFPTQVDALETLYFQTHEVGKTNILACPLLNYIPIETTKKENQKTPFFVRLEKIEPELFILTPTIGTEDIRKEFEEKKKKKDV